MDGMGGKRETAERGDVHLGNKRFFVLITDRRICG